MTELEDAATELCDTLDKVSEDTKGIFTSAWLHGVYYTGANYSKALERVRKALAASRQS